MKKVLVIVLVVLIGLLSFVAYGLFKDLNSNDDAIISTQEPEITPTPEVIDYKKLYIDKMKEEMTIEEKIGQLFIVRYDGSLDALDKHVGGIILFGQDFKDKTKDEVIAMTSNLQENSKLPLFIGTDEEGGIVNRVSINPNLRDEPFKSPQALYNEGGLELIKEDTKEKCELLNSLGINLNFAPVSDVSEDSDDYIYYRTFGKNAQETEVYVKTVVSVMKENGILSCLKHFPGYGNNVDTHSNIGHDYRDQEVFWENDFLPFSSGIRAGADFVLVSHNIIESIDSEYPASLSKKVHDILRDELSFHGLIITDDLIMQGITDLYGSEKAAILAFKAGNDILLSTDYHTQIDAMINAYYEGEISEDMIDESLERVLSKKIDLGMIKIN